LGDELRDALRPERAEGVIFPAAKRKKRRHSTTADRFQQRAVATYQQYQFGKRMDKTRRWHRRDISRHTDAADTFVIDQDPGARTPGAYSYPVQPGISHGAT
jgi:hypothetical protein